LKRGRHHGRKLAVGDDPSCWDSPERFVSTGRVTDSSTLECLSMHVGAVWDGEPATCRQAFRHRHWRVGDPKFLDLKGVMRS